MMYPKLVVAEIPEKPTVAKCNLRKLILDDAFRVNVPDFGSCVFLLV
ncbi:MAG: hypothetical protein KME59_13770 [Trichormus sp. ATA11-4-KO1]|nr:hypothetical protein [Trichormus sp. ATA11-4-KO1]